MSKNQKNTTSVWWKEQGDIDLNELTLRGWSELHRRHFSTCVEELTNCRGEIPDGMIDDALKILQAQGLEMQTVRATLRDMVGVHPMAVRADANPYLSQHRSK